MTSDRLMEGFFRDSILTGPAHVLFQGIKPGKKRYGIVPGHMNKKTLLSVMKILVL
jgi:hypothetical protein